MVNLNNIQIGTRYWRYLEDNDEVEELRIIGYQDTETVKVINLNTKEKLKMKIEQIIENYKPLTPDGIICISIAKLADNLNDVMVTLHRMEDIKSKNTSEPYCVCRQCITDIFANQIKIKNKTYCGSCVSVDTCPVDVDYNVMLACDGLERQEMIVVYIDDKLEDILSMIKPKEYDKVLYKLFYDFVAHKTKNYGEIMFKEYLKLDSIEGYCKTLKLLLEHNNFMYDFHRAFNIVSLNVNMDDMEGKPLDDSIKGIIEKLFCVNIKASEVWKYDKSINLKSIQQKYFLISDSNYNLYIVGYFADEVYHVPIEDVESQENIQNIYSALNSKIDQNAVKDAYGYLNLNRDKYQ